MFLICFLFKVLNPFLDGSDMMRELTKLLIEFLSLNFSALSQAETSFVLDLESIYPEKFSRHVVFPKVVIQDVVQVQTRSCRLFSFLNFFCLLSSSVD